VDFVAVVDQAIALLRQRGRVAYRTLQRQFQLDDETLEDLTDDLIYAKQLAAAEDGRVLVWTGGTSRAPTTASPVPPPAHRPPCRTGGESGKRREDTAYA
jgi:hypothetical protein